MHKQTMYDCGFWHGKHSRASEQMTTSELQGYANACMLGMIERQELPVGLTYEQEIECEDSWVQGYNDARQI